jgi:hypothetical protein
MEAATGLRMEAYYSTVEWIESLPFAASFTRTEIYIEMQWRYGYPPATKGEMNFAVQWCLRNHQIIAIAADRWRRI